MSAADYRPLAGSFVSTTADSPRPSASQRQRPSWWPLVASNLLVCAFTFLASELWHYSRSSTILTTSEPAPAAAAAAHHAPAHHPSAFAMISTSGTVILVIIALLYIYEISVHWAKHHIPQALQPVLNVMLAEIAGLGFIGLLLQVFEGYFAHQIEAISEVTLGEEEALVEAFEWFHNQFFKVATIFCVFGGGMLVYMVSDIRRLLADISKADADGDGDVTVAEFKAAFGEDSLEEKTFWQMVASRTLGLSTADSYLFSRRFMEHHQVDKATFNPIAYVESVGAANLHELVEMSPFCWLMMLPPLAYMEYTKIKKEVPGDDLSGAAAGIYAESPVLLLFTLVIECFGVLWTAYNYSKMLAVKRLLRPRIFAPATAAAIGAKLQVHAPKLYDHGALDEYLATHQHGLLRVTHVAAVLTNSRGAAEHPHHKLFGTAGDKGAELLLLSIKFNMWFCIAAVTFCFTSIVFPDLAAVAAGTASADAKLELVIFGAMGASFTFLLACVVPPTFSMFNVLTSIEGMKSDDALHKAHGAAPAAPSHGHH